jgi:hypothetical protein
MDTWVIVLIIGVLIVLAIAFVMSRRARERQLQGRREEASELRSSAEEQSQRAEQRASLAEEQAEQARRERGEAEEQIRRADELDPDADADVSR